MAEPSGEYQVDLSVDLSPIYGKIEDRQTIAISRPPADILERRLAECASDDAAARRRAAQDLAYFKDDGERVFPALIRCLDDADEGVRSAAVYSMGRYPEQIAEHPEAMIRVLGDERLDASRRGYAAYLLSEHGPLTEPARAALSAAKERASDDDRSRFASALERFEERAKARAAGGR
ncbi:MAG: HEAT repeat domain-containing protein [Planctomycetes bacterium]|nr:HEAT repeat domain-containing protein [Planctomycetota bacterium]